MGAHSYHFIEHVVQPKCYQTRTVQATCIICAAQMQKLVCRVSISNLYTNMAVSDRGPLTWTPPQEPIYKINVDGAVFAQLIASGVGVVITYQDPCRWKLWCWQEFVLPGRWLYNVMQCLRVIPKQSQMQFQAIQLHLQLLLTLLWGSNSN